jgi:mandelamide amidase
VGFRPSVGNGGPERRYDGAGVLPISHTRDTIGPMARTVADVALLDAVVTGAAPVDVADLTGVRIGLPASLWESLDPEVGAVTHAACGKLTRAGVVLVDVDVVGLRALDEALSFPIGLHEPLADIPAYLAASGIDGVTLGDIAAQAASPDVQYTLAVVTAGVFGALYADAVDVKRPALQALYARYFAEHHLDALLFPTTPLPAVPIDLERGSGFVSIDGGLPIDTFSAFVRNTAPGSNAGIPGLALHAGMSATGLPVGVELDGPLGSDRRLLAIGMAIEAVLGRAPAPAL